MQIFSRFLVAARYPLRSKRRIHVLSSRINCSGRNQQQRLSLWLTSGKRRGASISATWPPPRNPLPGKGMLLPRLPSRSYSTETVVTETDIKNHLVQLGLEPENGFTSLVAKCPFCGVGSSSKIDANEDAEVYSPLVAKLHVNKTTAWTQCVDCQFEGTWSNFLRSLAEKSSSTTAAAAATNPFLAQDEADSLMEDRKNLENVWNSSVGLKNSQYLAQFKRAFAIEPLSRKTLADYNVRLDVKGQRLLLPMYNLKGVMVALKALEPKGNSSIIPSKRCRGLFGLEAALNPRGQRRPTHLVLTANELDALAVSQQVPGAHAISLPLGVSALPQEVLPLLEQFTTITLWLGNDLKTWNMAKQFAKKLDPQRCWFIRPEFPPPLLAMKKELDFNKILRVRVAAETRNVVHFSSLWKDILNEVDNSDQVSGVKWRRFTELNRILKGHRPGELTVFVGPTGAGKTTFMSEYSLDLTLQGVNTLWGSFEIRNSRLAKMMAEQCIRKCLHNCSEEERRTVAREFQALPLHFMNFHGPQKIETVIQTMSQAVYVHDIQHVILDNLQFMAGNHVAADRFSVYDRAIYEFRHFATEKNCHVTLVAHPRKEEGEKLWINSIFGSAKASQDADNVMILQAPRGHSKKYIEVVKNRFTGDLGSMPLTFNREGGLVMSRQPREAGHSGKGVDGSPYRSSSGKEVDGGWKSGGSVERKRTERETASVPPPPPQQTAKRETAAEQQQTPDLPHPATKKQDVSSGVEKQVHVDTDSLIDQWCYNGNRDKE